MSQPTVFISYSHQDEDEKEALVSHLGVLAQAGLIDVWVDDRIEGGGNWEQDIAGAMSQAKVAILLVTRHFLNSKFILGTEVPTLLERRKREGVVVYPVIAKPCAWQRVDWLAKMNVRPKNGTPVWSKESDPDEELAKIAEEVARIIEKAGGSGDGSSAVPPKDKPAQPPVSSPIRPRESGASRSGDVNISGISGGNVKIGNVVTGNVGGDVVGGDKTGGDKVGGDKAGRDIAGRDINYHYHNNNGNQGWNWEKIGAIAGVIGVILAFLAFIISPDLRALIFSTATPTPIPTLTPISTPTVIVSSDFVVRVFDEADNKPVAQVEVVFFPEDSADFQTKTTDDSGVVRFPNAIDKEKKFVRVTVSDDRYERYDKTTTIDIDNPIFDVFLMPK